MDMPTSMTLPLVYSKRIQGRFCVKQKPVKGYLFM